MSKKLTNAQQLELLNQQLKQAEEMLYKFKEYGKTEYEYSEPERTVEPVEPVVSEKSEKSAKSEKAESVYQEEAALDYKCPEQTEVACEKPKKRGRKPKSKSEPEQVCVDEECNKENVAVYQVVEQPEEIIDTRTVVEESKLEPEPAASVPVYVYAKIDAKRLAQLYKVFSKKQARSLFKAIRDEDDSEHASDEEYQPADGSKDVEMSVDDVPVLVVNQRPAKTLAEEIRRKTIDKRIAGYNAFKNRRAEIEQKLAELRQRMKQKRI